MNSGQRFLALVASFALATIAGTAQAAPFTLLVPVRLANLPPEVRSFSVSCELVARGSGKEGHSPQPVGRASSNYLDIVNGDYQGEVSIEMTINPDWHPSQVTDYKCRVSFKMRNYRDGSENIITIREDDPLDLHNSHNYRPFPLATGAPLQVMIEGPVR